jgi:hypothetical protein
MNVRDMHGSAKCISIARWRGKKVLLLGVFGRFSGSMIGGTWSVLKIPHYYFWIWMCLSLSTSKEIYGCGAAYGGFLAANRLAVGCGSP